MVFSTTTLFKGIACPSGDNCKLTNCMFSHELGATLPAISQQKPRTVSNPATVEKEDSGEPPSKKRRVTYESAAAKPPSRADRIRSELAAVRSGATKPSDNRNMGSSFSRATNIHSDSAKPPPSLTRPVSPPRPLPPTNGRLPSRTQPGTTNNGSVNGTAQLSEPEPKPSEPLNPRLIPNDPAGHSKRTLYLKHLHFELARLNRMVSDAPGLEHKHLLHLRDQEVTTLCLDEEEKVAKDSGTLYPNIIKQRIAYWKKNESWGSGRSSSSQASRRTCRRS